MLHPHHLLTLQITAYHRIGILLRRHASALQLGLELPGRCLPRVCRFRLRRERPHEIELRCWLPLVRRSHVQESRGPVGELDFGILVDRVYTYPFCVVHVWREAETDEQACPERLLNRIGCMIEGAVRGVRLKGRDLTTILIMYGGVRYVYRSVLDSLRPELLIQPCPNLAYVDVQ